MKISWPTAVVLAVFVIGWVVLAAMGKPIPAWMAASAAVVGKLILLAVQSMFPTGGSSSGGGIGSVSKLPSTSASSNGPVPPAAARMGWLLLPRWSTRALLTATAVWGLLIAACLPNGAPTPQTVTDVVIGLHAAECVLTTYPTDKAQGMTEIQAIADTAFKCGVTVAQATGLLDSHRKAEVAEGFVLPPDAGAK